MIYHYHRIRSGFQKPSVFRAGILALGVVALDAPPSNGGDQQTKESSHDQDYFGLGRTAPCLSLAEHQQSQLFALHLTDQLLYVIQDLFAGFFLDRGSSGLQTICPAQGEELLCELEFLRGKYCECIKPLLLSGVIRRQTACDCLVLLRLGYTGAINLEKGLVASQ